MAERRYSAPAQTGASCVLFFFNLKDGNTVLDDHGVECATVGEARIEGIRATADKLQHRLGQDWKGEPWFLWVTDQPKGNGNTVLSLTCGADSNKSGLVIEVVLAKETNDKPDRGTKH